MATAALANDELSMNRFNPYTWSGSYGVNTDGFAKDVYMDGSYYTQRSDEPMEQNAVVEGSERNLVSSIFLKTASVDPAPTAPFPARKYEWEDGTTSWYRPGASTGASFGPLEQLLKAASPGNLLVWLVLAVIALHMYRTMKK
jgi:hypothetical protein